MKISVVIPVYNEIDTIEEILARVDKVSIKKEIIVIDDLSIDGTRERLKKIVADKENVKVIYHNRNKGKGAALRTGFESVTGDIVIIQDADLEYDPNEYPNLLEPIADGRADVVYGSRFIGGPHRVLFFWHYVGNKLLTLISNALTNLNLTDMETCYKMAPTKHFRAIQDDLLESRFGIEIELTARWARRGLRFTERPIRYQHRWYDAGKKIGWRDGVRALWCIVKYGLFGR